MARIRSLKPEFAKSEAIACLPRDVRLHFALLWTYADDDGRGVDNPKLIKAELWPLDDDVDSFLVDDWQTVLEKHGRIVRYESGGKRFFEIANFTEHQKPQKKTDSKLPPAPAQEQDDTTEPLPEQSRSTDVEVEPVVVVGEVAVEGEGVLAPPRSARKPDPLFDAFAEEVSYRPSTTKERAAWNGALKELREAGATADQVHHACTRYRSEWPNVTLTLPALAKHFGRLVNGKTGPVVSKSMNVAAEWGAS